MPENQQHRGNSTKDKLKSIATSVDEAHILSLVSKLASTKEFLQENSFVEEIESCLRELDSIPEISMILRALNFSDHVMIVLDFERDDLSVVNSDALGWYNCNEGELLLGAKHIRSNRHHFSGVFAHELAHWGMQTVFENDGLPYFGYDPDRVTETTFGQIVKLCQNQENLPDVIRSVFRDYPPGQRAKELIVRVPHLMASLGPQEACAILSSHESTRQLLNFYRTHIMREFNQFISEAHLLKSRQTISNLNKKLGLLKTYTDLCLRFKSQLDMSVGDGQLLVLSSHHPMLSFLKCAWSLNCLERTSKFTGNHIFCDLDNFSSYHQDILSSIRGIGECKILVLLCQNEEDEDNLCCLLKILKASLNEQAKKGVLIIKEAVFDTLQREMEGQKIENRAIQLPKMPLVDLDVSSRKTVLESLVNAQGTVKELKDILDESEGQKLVDGVLIERFLNKEIVPIGKRITSLLDLPPSFVRFYESLSEGRLVELVTEFLHGERKRLVVLIGDIEHLSEGVRAELAKILSCDIQDCRVTSDEGLQQVSLPLMVHSLKFETDYAWLVKTLRGISSFELMYFVRLKSKKKMYCDMLYWAEIVLYRRLSSATSTIDQDSFINLITLGDDKVVILSDGAGTGKSQLINIIIDSLTDRWVMKLSLKQTSTLLDDLTDCTDEDEVLNLICGLGGVEDGFATELLKFRMRNPTKTGFILLLDGLDEITSSDGSDVASNKNKIGNLVALLESTHVTTVITTRPESMTFLSHLKAPIFEFVPISLEESHSYLSKLCFGRCSLLPEKFSENAVRQTVDQYLENSQLPDDFLEIPLHASMLSEIIVDDIRKGVLPLTPQQEKMGLDELYSKFVKIKYELYFREKTKTPFDPRLEDQCDSVFEALALFYLFGNEDFAKRYLSKSKLFNSKNGTLSLKCEKAALYSDIGVISCSDSSSLDFEFIHQTFAEYFASRLFISWTDDEDRSQIVVKEVFYEVHRVLSFFELMLPRTQLSEETMIVHGNTMVKLEFDETIRGLRYLIWFDKLHALDFVLRCWASIDQLQKIISAANYDHKPLNYPLLFAVSNSTERIIRRLLQEDFDVNFRSSETNVISQFLKKGDTGLLNELIKRKQVIWENANDRATLIHDAASGGNLEVVEWLEKQGFSLSSVDHLGRSAIAYAIRSGHLELAKWLKSRSLDLNYSIRGHNAIHDATFSRNCEMIKWLVEERVDINGQNEHGFTPLHLCILRREMIQVIKCLCALGADIHVRSNNGFNALHLAASEGYLEVVQWLVSEGSKLEERTNNGATALHLALKANASCAEWLIKIADVSATNSFGRGCLHYNAASRRTRFLVPLLIEKGCDVNLRDNNGLTAAHIAISTMAELDPYHDLETEKDREDYRKSMLVPFQSLVTEMLISNYEILTELISFAMEKLPHSASLILAEAVDWMSLLQTINCKCDHFCA